MNFVRTVTFAAIALFLPLHGFSEEQVYANESALSKGEILAVLAMILAITAFVVIMIRLSARKQPKPEPPKPGPYG